MNSVGRALETHEYRLVSAAQEVIRNLGLQVVIDDSAMDGRPRFVETRKHVAPVASSSGGGAVGHSASIAFHSLLQVFAVSGAQDSDEVSSRGRVTEPLNRGYPVPSCIPSPICPHGRPGWLVWLSDGRIKSFRPNLFCIQELLHACQPRSTESAEFGGQQRNR